MTATSSTTAAVADAVLVRRLWRRAVQPGLVDPRQAPALLARSLGLTPGVPLADRLARRASIAEDGRGGEMPIVFAQARPPANGAVAPGAAGDPFAAEGHAAWLRPVVSATATRPAGSPMTSPLPLAPSPSAGAGAGAGSWAAGSTPALVIQRKADPGAPAVPELTPQPGPLPVAHDGRSPAMQPEASAVPPLPVVTATRPVDQPSRPVEWPLVRPSLPLPDGVVPSTLGYPIPQLASAAGPPPPIPVRARPDESGDGTDRQEPAPPLLVGPAPAPGTEVAQPEGPVVEVPPIATTTPAVRAISAVPIVAAVPVVRELVLRSNPAGGLPTGIGRHAPPTLPLAGAPAGPWPAAGRSPTLPLAGAVAGSPPESRTTARPGWDGPVTPSGPPPDGRGIGAPGQNGQASADSRSRGSTLVAEVDIDRLVERVHRRFVRRLAIEGERRGAR